MAKVTTVEMLNAIRNEASQEYQTRIPEATRTNLEQIGRTLTEYTVLLNEFTNALVVKIGLQVFSSKMANNKLSRFKRGLLENGTDIEEIFVSMAKSVGFDKEGKNPLGRRMPDIKTLYHRENMQKVYEVTVSQAQVKNAFTSSNGVQNLINEIVQSMYSGANYDEYIQMKELLASYSTNYSTYQVTAITNEASAKSFVKAVRKAIADLSYVSNEYNNAGVDTYSEKSELVLLVNKDILAEVDVEVLAKAFNMGKTDLEAEIVEVDNFGTMTDTYALLVDKRFFMVYDTLRRVESIFNPQGLFTNYFLHIWQIHSLSSFRNAVKFTTAASVIEELAPLKETKKSKKDKEKEEEGLLELDSIEV